VAFLKIDAGMGWTKGTVARSHVDERFDTAESGKRARVERATRTSTTTKTMILINSKPKLPRNHRRIAAF
jgi:hypothetical protein